MSKYFDVIINGNSFYISESTSKPKESPLTILEKIEHIVAQKLHYDPKHQGDTYYKQDFDLLKTISTKIHDNYQEKVSKLNWVSRKIFSKEKKINNIYKNIETIINRYIDPRPLFPSLPKDCTQEIVKYLTASDLGTLSQVSSQGWSIKENAKEKRAQELGWLKNNHSSADLYLKKLFKEINELARLKVFPEKYLVYHKSEKLSRFGEFLRENFGYRKKKLDEETTLQNLQNAPIEDIFTIFSNRNLYSWESIKEFRGIFAQKWMEINLKKGVSKTPKWQDVSDDSQLEGRKALVWAVMYKDKQTVKFLLELGVSPQTHLDGEFCLQMAIRSNSTEIADLLRQYGA